MGRPTKKEVWKRNIAYGVTKMTPEVVLKFEQAFAIGATINEACDYADVSPATYYLWVKKYPELLEKFSRMREKLPLKSKENIARRIHGESTTGDIGLSKWLIERQQPGEYAETINLKHSGEIHDGVPQEDKDIIDELHEKLRKNRLNRVVERAKADGTYIDPKNENS